MTPEQFKRAEALYFEANELPSAEHVAFLNERCPDDELVRDQVLDLLGPKPQTETLEYVERKIADALGDGGSLELELRPGDRVGRYKIVQEIGSGGMGVVYEALQVEPVRRRVALKLIKVGMDTREVVARFESERQALAMMDHPNVAAVLDGGSTETGRPYFVMEYVPGQPITTYCDKHKLSIEQRLELFTQVCSAIQHAHQKGIIHRDIKPSNVLARLQGDKPTSIVIDFGVAKAINQHLVEQTLFTQQGMMVGTPEYMSPEQAGVSMLDVDTRSDVYSLGVLLYELLTGALPFDHASLRQAGFLEIQRIIQEVEPPRPSTRFRSLSATPEGKAHSSAAMQRRLDPRSLTRRLRGDLDWIVMKALEKDPARRYATAHEFAADISRYLTNQPVSAGPPTAGYRLRKYVRRNRGSVAAACLIVLSLMAGIVGTSWQAVVANRALDRANLAKEAESRERQRAEREQKRAESVVDFLDTTLTAAEYKGVDVTVVDVMALAESQLASVDGSTEAKAEILNVIGRAVVAAGDYEGGIGHLRRAQQLAQSSGNTLDAAVIGTSLGSVVASHLDPDEGERILRESLAAIEQSDRSTWDQRATALNNLGEALLEKSENIEAKACFEQARDLVRANTDGAHRQLGPALSGLACIAFAQDQPEEALALFERALAAMSASWGPLHRNTVTVRGNLAYMYGHLGKDLRARKLYETVIEDARSQLGKTHPLVAELLDYYGAYLGNRDDPRAAEVPLLEAYEIRERRFGPRDPRTLITARNLVQILGASKRQLEMAEALARTLLDEAAQRHGANSQESLAALFDLNSVLRIRGNRSAEAEQLLRKEIELAVTLYGPTHSKPLGAMHRLAGLLYDGKRLDEAATILADAVELGTQAEEPPYLLWVLRYSYAKCLQKMQRFDAAEQQFLESLAIVNKDKARRNDVALVMGFLVDLYNAWHEADPSRGADKKAAEWQEKLTQLQSGQ
jgi:serine/threonine protein kinase